MLQMAMEGCIISTKPLVMVQPNFFNIVWHEVEQLLKQLKTFIKGSVLGFCCLEIINLTLSTCFYRKSCLCQATKQNNEQ